MLKIYKEEHIGCSHSHSLHSVAAGLKLAGGITGYAVLNHSRRRISSFLYLPHPLVAICSLVYLVVYILYIYKYIYNIYICIISMGKVKL